MDRLAAVNWTAYQDEALAAIGAALSEQELEDARVKAVTLTGSGNGSALRPAAE